MVYSLLWVLQDLYHQPYRVLWSRSVSTQTPVLRESHVFGCIGSLVKANSAEQRLKESLLSQFSMGHRMMMMMMMMMMVVLSVVLMMMHTMDIDICLYCYAYHYRYYSVVMLSMFTTFLSSQLLLLLMCLA